MASETAHSLEASLKYVYLDYQEELSAPLKSSEKGFLPYLRAGYAYRGIRNPLYARVFFEYADSPTDYDGSTQAGEALKATTHNRFLNLESDIGYTLKARAGGLPLEVTFFTGYGYRTWHRGLGGASPYSEEYKWQYIPLGVQTRFRITERWTGSVEGVLWILFHSQIQVYFSDINPFYNNPKADLGNHLGWKLELPFDYRISKHWSAEAAPAYEFYSFGKSDLFPVTYMGRPAMLAYEPDSRTHQWSMRVGLKLHF